MRLVISISKQIIILSPIFCALLIPNSAVAQSWYSNVPDIEVSLDTITGFEPTPIAVEDPTSQTGATLFPSDQSDLLEMARVIRNDLDFSPFCEIVLIDSAYVRHLQLKEMNSQTWRRLGADYFVRLEAKITKQEISIGYEVTFTPSDRVSAKGRFSSPRKFYRALAHTISNDIIKKVFSEDGIFLSQVCYVVRKGNVKDLYIADYDGAGATRILSNGSINLSPVFTPDGAEILFTSYLDGFPKIYSFDLKRGKTKLIAGYQGLNTAPAISPDGDRIACVLSKDGNAEIYLLDRRGRIIRRLTRTRAIENSPTFSPDGREIVFSSDRSGSPQIYIMDTEGLNVRRITYQGRYNDSPIWSPRGDLILFVGRTKSGRFDICTITPTGQNYTILTNNGANENPHFSPDGNNIIFSSTRLGFKEIFTMDRFGRRQRRLTRTGRADGSRDASNPSWSPDFNFGGGGGGG